MSSSPFRNRSFASRSAVAASRFAQLMVVSAALVTGGLAMGGCPGSLENPERFTGGGGEGRGEGGKGGEDAAGEAHEGAVSDDVT